MGEGVIYEDNSELFRRIGRLEVSESIPENIKKKLGEIKTVIEPFDPERLKNLTKELSTQLTGAIIGDYKFEREELRELNKLSDTFRVRAERPEKIKEFQSITECLSESLGALRSNAPMPDCLSQKSR